LIRALADDPRLEVPSPTFTLVQTYGGRVPVAHFDLYRVRDPSELDEIGFDEARSDNAVLIEWPERAGNRLPADRFDIVFEIEGAGRTATLSAAGPSAARLERSRAVRKFLASTGWGDSARRYLQGDASTRTYERIGSKSDRAVL